MTYDSVVQELDGLIDSLDEHVTIEDVGSALGELRANVFERAKAEGAHTPTDDEREVLARIVRDETGEADEEAGFVADAILVAGFRRSEVPEQSAAGYAEFADWEQEMFRHQPVLSMTDGAIAGCQCHLAHVFVKDEDWGTHLATIITSRVTADPRGEPSDAQLLAQGFRDGVNYIEDQPGPWGACVVAGRAEAARRVAAAGGVQ